ncbi:unnamed protein product [Blepharisma stoltei]|uniref:PUM-HD domain-containing protein n=1 Tax=Blepharisma stoltei TaxID=1481888 RepID=A0AAU9J6T1_9CILI|nr:unnamed protein product [Blepharisma stoltei]
MNEIKLIGNILAEDNDSDEEQFRRFTKTKRHVLLNKDELDQLIERPTSAPSVYLPFPQVFWPEKEEEYSIPKATNDLAALSINEDPKPAQPSVYGPSLNLGAAEFVPGNFQVSMPPPKRSELADIRGRIAEMSREQAGSRYLQQKIETVLPEDKQLIFEEIYRAGFGLLVDVFGNYVVQKVLEYGNLEQRRSIANLMSGRVIELSTHMYGCRVVQKALEVVEIDQKRYLAHELRGHVEKCVEDQNANHVVQKCVEVLPYPYMSFIVDDLRMNTIYWAEHAYGCRVVQRIIEFCPKEAIMDMVNAIIRNAVDLSKKNYGNYVIQHILDKEQAPLKSQLIVSFLGRLYELSKHKFASNVIEKCLIVGNPEHIRAFAKELFAPEHVFELMTDKFANFVIQKALEVSRGEVQNQLILKVTEHSAALKTFPYGRHVLTCLEKVKKGISNQ